MTPTTIIYFGKYSGKTIAQIQILDKLYYKWLEINWVEKNLGRLNKSKTPIVKVYEEKEVYKETEKKYLCYCCGMFKSKFRMVDKVRICYVCSDSKNANQIPRLVAYKFKKLNK